MSTDINTRIIEGYLQMLDNLSPGSKLDLISKLSASVKSDIKNKKSTFKRAFGAFQSERSADEIINEIRSSRTFTRQIEEFWKYLIDTNIGIYYMKGKFNLSEKFDEAAGNCFISEITLA